MLGTTVGHYILEAELGRGTYGVVWRAVHRHDPDLRVAIKIVHPSLVGDPAFVRSLKEECRRLDRLDHPGIVRFRDLVIEDQITAMVLELLEGSDLHGRLGGRPLELDAAIPIIEVMLDALGYAHARGVVHRDIKPSNVFWSDDGRVKLLDFGVARAADGAHATKTGQLVGTLDYMAPERFSGGGGLGMDVYALGLVAWEMLTGRIACPEGDLAGKMGWHLAVGAPRLRTIRPDCPPWVEELVARLTLRDPNARPADGGAAFALFHELKTSAPVGQTSLSPSSPRRPPPQTVTTAIPPSGGARKAAEAVPASSPPRAVPAPARPVSNPPRSAPPNPAQNKPISIPPPPGSVPPRAPSVPPRPASVPPPVASVPPRPPSVPPPIASVPPSVAAAPPPVASVPPVETAPSAPSNPPPAAPSASSASAAPVASVPPTPSKPPSPPPPSNPPQPMDATPAPGASAPPKPARSLLVPVLAVGAVGVLGVGGLIVVAAGAGGAWSYLGARPSAATPGPAVPAVPAVDANDAWTALLAGAKYDPATEQAVMGFLATYGTANTPPPEAAFAASWLDQYDAWRTIAVPTTEVQAFDMGGTVDHLAIDPAGATLATSGPDKRVETVLIADGTIGKLGAVDAAPSALAWNPTGGGIAVASGATVQFFAIGPADPRAALTAHTHPVTGLAFAKDGALYSGADKVIAQGPGGDTKYTWTMPDGDGSLKVVALPDGRVGAIGTKGVLRVWKSDSGERIGDAALGVAPAAVAWVDPDLIVGTTGKLLAVDPASGGTAWSWTTDGTVTAVSASPSGWIAIGTDRGTVVILDGTTHAELGRWQAAAAKPVDLVALGDQLAVVASDAKARLLGPDPAKLKDFPPATTIGPIPGPTATPEPVAAVAKPAADADAKSKMKPEFASVVGTYDLYADRTDDQCGVPGLQFSYDTIRIDGSGMANASGSGAKRSFKASIAGPVLSWSDTHVFPDGGCDGGKERTSWRLIKRPDAAVMGGTVVDSIDVLVGGGACVTCDIVTTVRLVPR